jgi:hypothetical protein
MLTDTRSIQMDEGHHIPSPKENNVKTIYTLKKNC